MECAHVRSDLEAESTVMRGAPPRCTMTPTGRATKEGYISRMPIGVNNIFTVSLCVAPGWEWDTRPVYDLNRPEDWIDEALALFAQADFA